MRVWITRDERGLYYVSGLRPVVKQIGGTERWGIYPRPGDMLWLDKLCEEGICHAFGHAVEEANVPVRGIIECAFL